VTVTYSKLPNRLVSAANGIDYAYRDAGDGAVPLVLLQYFRGNLDSWDPALIDALAATRPVLTFDNTGVGGSRGTTPNLIQQMAPLIDPGYLTDPSDVTRVIDGLRAARTIAAARALAPFRDKELFPGAGADTDAACRAYLRSTITTFFHPVGTCKIGTNAMAVIDPQLKVRGIGHLRIADASVMPSVPSGHTNAPVLTIAQYPTSRC